MKITVLCTDDRHPVFIRLRAWAEKTAALGHVVKLVTDKRQLEGGDLLFLVSCSQLVTPYERARYREAFVLHASDLPRDRGWSPHIWSIVEGASEVTVCMIDARDPVDTGNIRARRSFVLEGHELLDEINQCLFDAELDLMDEAVRSEGQLPSIAQVGPAGTYRTRRTPEHSQLDPARPLQDQFNLLRVVDNERYPAYFVLNGHKYILAITKDKSA